MPSDRETQAPQAEMKDAELNAGAKERGAYAGKALRNNIEIWRFAQRQPTRAQLRHVVAYEFAPARAHDPRARQPNAHGLAGIAQNTFDNGEARLGAIAGRDRDRNFVDALPAGGEAIEHGVR